MAGISTVETKLYIVTGGGLEGNQKKLLTGLMEVPEIGGDAEKLEVTTLEDTVKKYIPGLRDFGDLAFNFLYDNVATTSNYRVLKGLEETKALTSFVIEYPDTTTHAFQAYVTCKMGAASVNGVLTFTASLSLQSDITTMHPTN